MTLRRPGAVLGMARLGLWLVVAFAMALLAGRAAAAETTHASAPFDAAVAAARSSMMASPSSALRAAVAAGRIARAMPPGRDAERAIATAEWLEGEAYARLNAHRRALPILEHALATIERIDPRDRLRGDLLLSRGWVEGALGNIPRALNDFQAAHAVFHALNDKRGQAKALQNIAGIYHDAGDDRRSLHYSAQVAELAADDPAIALAAFNNVGEALKSLRQYSAAERQYRSALRAAEKVGSPLLQVRVLTNLASAQLLNGDPGSATATTRRALALSAKGEAAGDRPFVIGILGEIAAAQHEYKRAGDLISRTFEGVDLQTSTLPYREFHQQAAEIYRKLGRADLAYAHLAAYKRLDDGARALAASTNAALMAAKFDFTSQNLHIERLKTDQVRDRARLHVVIFSIALGAAGLILLLLLANAISMRRSRNEVRAANALLTESNESLERALKVKSDFLATTSHEIRTPLNGILGMTQVMLADPRTDARTRDNIGIVHSAGETMRSLIDDILDLSKIETGHLSVTNAPLDLHALLRDAHRFWLGQATVKSLVLGCETDGSPQYIVGDAARLRQIVFNIMSNALKFTEHGHVTLSACAEAVEGGDQLCITVADSGIGIPDHQLELIFEKFHQVDGSTSRRFGGTGLGLAICRSLAAAMGGSIGVVSREGGGATFSLRLPLLRAPAGPSRSSTAVPMSAATRLAERDVLIVDANAFGQRVLAKALRASVRACDACATVDQAVVKLETQGFGAIVLQAQIAQDEADPTATIVRLIELAGVPAFVLHEAGADIDLERIASAGATIIVKPVAGSALAAAMQASVAAAGGALPAFAPAA